MRPASSRRGEWPARALKGASLFGTVAVLSETTGDIGKAIALALAVAAAGVVVIASDADWLERVGEEVGAVGRSFAAVFNDLCDAGSLSDACVNAWVRSGGVDSLVNAADTMVRRDGLDVWPADWATRSTSTRVGLSFPLRVSREWCSNVAAGRG